MIRPTIQNFILNFWKFLQMLWIFRGGGANAPKTPWLRACFRCNNPISSQFIFLTNNQSATNAGCVYRSLQAGCRWETFFLHSRCCRTGAMLPFNDKHSKRPFHAKLRQKQQQLAGVKAWGPGTFLLQKLLVAYCFVENCVAFPQLQV